MPDQMMKTFGGNFDLAATDGRMSQYEWSPEAELLYKQGKLDEVEALIYGDKTVKGLDLTARIVQHAVVVASQFTAEAFAIEENVCRSSSSQAYFESAIGPVLSQFPEYLRAEVQAGAFNIGRVAARSVAVNPPKKYFWQK